MNRRGHGSDRQNSWFQGLNVQGVAAYTLRGLSGGCCWSLSVLEFLHVCRQCLSQYHGEMALRLTLSALILDPVFAKYRRLYRLSGLMSQWPRGGHHYVRRDGPSVGATR